MAEWKVLTVSILDHVTNIKSFFQVLLEKGVCSTKKASAL